MLEAESVRLQEMVKEARLRLGRMKREEIYSLLLHLFPKAYRVEYGAELQIVFNSSLSDAVGRTEEIKIFLRELMGLPGAILYEHLRERRKAKMTGKFASRFDFPQGSRMEPWAVLLPFVLTYILYRSTFLVLFLNISNMPIRMGDDNWFTLPGFNLRPVSGWAPYGSTALVPALSGF